LTEHQAPTIRSSRETPSALRLRAYLICCCDPKSYRTGTPPDTSPHPSNAL
jgi:hypothetical protein